MKVATTELMWLVFAETVRLHSDSPLCNRRPTRLHCDTPAHDIITMNDISSFRSETALTAASLYSV